MNVINPSPDAIDPHYDVALRTPHTAILDAGLATHEARLLGHFGSSAVFVKTTLKEKSNLKRVCS